jgi:hypothetical protein
MENFRFHILDLSFFNHSVSIVSDCSIQNRIISQFTCSCGTMAHDLRKQASKRFGQLIDSSTSSASPSAVKKARGSLEHNERETSRCNDQIIAATLGITDDDLVDAQPVAVQRQLAAMAHMGSDGLDDDEDEPSLGVRVPVFACSVRGCPFRGLAFPILQELLDHAAAEHPKNKWAKERCVLFQVRQCTKCERLFQSAGDICEHLLGVGAAETIPNDMYPCENWSITIAALKFSSAREEAREIS